MQGSAASKMELPFTDQEYSRCGRKSGVLDSKEVSHPAIDLNEAVWISE